MAIVWCASHSDLYCAPTRLDHGLMESSLGYASTTSSTFDSCLFNSPRSQAFVETSTFHYLPLQTVIPSRGRVENMAKLLSIRCTVGVGRQIKSNTRSTLVPLLCISYVLCSIAKRYFSSFCMFVPVSTPSFSVVRLSHSFSPGSMMVSYQLPVLAAMIILRTACSYPNHPSTIGHTADLNSQSDNVSHQCVSRNNC